MKKGEVMSDEQRAKISKKLKGIPRPPEVIARSCAARNYEGMPRGENHARWVGDSAASSSIHGWLIQNYPKTGICEFCGGIAGVDFKRTEHAFKFHPAPHTRNRDDYFELCSPCHWRFDEEFRVLPPHG